MKTFKVNITKAQVKSFLRASVPVVLQLGILMLPSAVGLASDAGKVGITPLQKPLEVITGALTSPIPILVTGGGLPA